MSEEELRDLTFHSREEGCPARQKGLCEKLLRVGSVVSVFAGVRRGDRHLDCRSFTVGLPELPCWKITAAPSGLACLWASLPLLLL